MTNLVDKLSTHLAAITPLLYQRDMVEKISEDARTGFWSRTAFIGGMGAGKTTTILLCIESAMRAGCKNLGLVLDYGMPKFAGIFGKQNSLIDGWRDEKINLFVLPMCDGFGRIQSDRAYRWGSLELDFLAADITVREKDREPIAKFLSTAATRSRRGPAIIASDEPLMIDGTWKTYHCSLGNLACRLSHQPSIKEEE